MHKLRISFAVVVLWCFTATFVWGQFIPSNIEPERVSPQTKIPLPSIAHINGYADHLLESGAVRPGQKYSRVHLRVPAKKYYNREDYPGLHRSYELPITAFYPDFSGVGDLQKKECIKAMRDGLWCSDELSIWINTLGPNGAQGLTSYWGEIVDPARLKSAVGRNATPSDLTLIGADRDDSSNLYYEGRTNYYRTQGSPPLYIECQEFTPVPKCETQRIQAKKSEALAFKVRFGLALLPEWKKIIDGTQTLMDTLIVQEYQTDIPATK